MTTKWFTRYHQRDGTFAETEETTIGAPFQETLYEFAERFGRDAGGAFVGVEIKAVGADRRLVFRRADIRSRVFLTK